MIHELINKHNAAHYFWGESCDSWVLADTEGLSVKQESMPGNTKESLHYHTNAQQFFFILKGTATFYLGTEKRIATAFSGLLIKPGTQHYIANEDTDRLDFLVISQPGTNNDRTNVQ